MRTILTILCSLTTVVSLNAQITAGVTGALKLQPTFSPELNLVRGSLDVLVGYGKENWFYSLNVTPAQYAKVGFMGEGKHGDEVSYLHQIYNGANVFLSVGRIQRFGNLRLIPCAQLGMGIFGKDYRFLEQGYADWYPGEKELLVGAALWLMHPLSDKVSFLIGTGLNGFYEERIEKWFYSAPIKFGLAYEFKK